MWVGPQGTEAMQREQDVKWLCSTILWDGEWGLFVLLVVSG